MTTPGFRKLILPLPASPKSSRDNNTWKVCRVVLSIHTIVIRTLHTQILHSGLWLYRSDLPGIFFLYSDSCRFQSLVYQKEKPASIPYATIVLEEVG